MNARTIYKQLMRRCEGGRTYFAVRIPMAYFAVPCPPFTPPGEKGLCSDSWVRVEGAESVRTSIYAVSAGYDPRSDTDRDVEPLHVAPDSHEGRWEWVEGIEVVKRDGEVVEQRACPRAIVDAWVAQRDWVRAHLRHTSDEYPYSSDPLVAALIQAGAWAKSVGEEVTPEHVTVHYYIKACYRDRPRRFAAEMRRAFKVARALGIDMRAVYLTS